MTSFFSVFNATGKCSSPFLLQNWLAEVEGRLPARTEQTRRQSGMYEAQNTLTVNNCAQDRERYSICNTPLSLSANGGTTEVCISIGPGRAARSPSWSVSDGIKIAKVLPYDSKVAYTESGHWYCLLMAGSVSSGR